MSIITNIDYICAKYLSICEYSPNVSPVAILIVTRYYLSNSLPCKSSSTVSYIHIAWIPLALPTHMAAVDFRLGTWTFTLSVSTCLSVPETSNILPGPSCRTRSPATTGAPPYLDYYLAAHALSVADADFSVAADLWQSLCLHFRGSWLYCCCRCYLGCGNYVWKANYL